MALFDKNKSSEPKKTKSLKEQIVDEAKRIAKNEVSSCFTLVTLAERLIKKEEEQD